MSYQGRSPIKDVVRSVVMGAGMISPALLEACASSTPNPPPPIPLVDPLADVDGGAEGGAASVATAPPTEVVRPRTAPTGNNMPTRGFAGAVRGRG